MACLVPILVNNYVSNGLPRTERASVGFPNLFPFLLLLGYEMVDELSKSYTCFHETHDVQADSISSTPVFGWRLDISLEVSRTKLRGIRIPILCQERNAVQHA